MIDFHCHITTESARTPTEEGKYYQTIKPLVNTGDWMNWIWLETMETFSENWRGPLALKQYEQVAPVIYTEMARRITQGTAQKLTLEMARNQVRQAVVVAMDPYVPTEEVVAACMATKGILLPFGSVDPWRPDWRETLEQVLNIPIYGFKFHDQLQQIPYGHSRMFEILDAISARKPKAAIYLHTGSFPIYKPLDGHWAHGLSSLLQRYPGLRFICGHCGWNQPSAAVRLARKYPNLWLETSWQPPQILRKICDCIGADRMVLGSDYPLYSMKRAIRNARFALTPEEFRLVAEDNARRLLEQPIDE